MVRATGALTQLGMHPPPPLGGNVFHAHSAHFSCDTASACNSLPVCIGVIHAYHYTQFSRRFQLQRRPAFVTKERKFSATTANQINHRILQNAVVTSHSKPNFTTNAKKSNYPLVFLHFSRLGGKSPLALFLIEVQSQVTAP